MSYEECEKIYAEAVILINKRLVRLIDVTVEQWLDLKYRNHKTMDNNVKNGVIGTWLIRSYKLQFEEYLEIKRQRETYAREIDWYTKNVLWVYWIRGDDEVILINEKVLDLKDKNNHDEQGDATQSVMNFWAWLKRSFGNFHELDYELLVKLQEYWWKVNDHECSPFTNWRDHIRGPYANYYSNVQDEEEQEDEERCNLFNDTTQEPPICEIKRFEMIEYSFGQEEEYVAIKEYEYDDLTRTNDDACHAYQEIFRNMDEGWLVIRAELRSLKKNLT
ncbi:hypothetical protein Tco_1143792 [Tanacetum coccineum]